MSAPACASISAPGCLASVELAILGCLAAHFVCVATAAGAPVRPAHPQFNREGWHSGNAHPRGSGLLLGALCYAGIVYCHPWRCRRSSMGDCLYDRILYLWPPNACRAVRS